MMVMMTVLMMTLLMTMRTILFSHADTPHALWGADLRYLAGVSAPRCPASRDHCPCTGPCGPAAASGEQRADHASFPGVFAPRSVGRLLKRETLKPRQLRDDVFPCKPHS